MVNKGRKLLALLLMVALVVTYTFGANLSVYAEDEQGDANAKTTTSESAEPAPAPEPAPQDEPTEPSTPAPTEPTTPDNPDPGSNPDNGGNTPSDGDGAITLEDSDATATEEATTEEKVKEDEGIVLEDGAVTLEHGESYDFTHRGNDRYERQSGSAGGWNRTGDTLTNQNNTNGDLTVTIRHSWGHYVVFFWVEDGYEDITFTLKPQKVDVTFKVKDADAEEYEVYSTIPVYKGSDVEAPEITDDNFYGWYKDEDCSEKATDSDFQGITQGTTFYGMYSSEATLKYYKNSGDEAATVPDEVTAPVGSKVKIGDATRDGYALAEWNTADDGSGDSYAPGEKVQMPAQGLKLYAQWSKDNMVIRYWENYGLEFDAWRSQTNVPKNYRTTLIEEMPSRDAIWPLTYIFRGWATSSNASTPDYYPGETIETGNANIMNLYAVWSILSLNELTPLTVKDKTETYNGTEFEITKDDIQGGTPYAQDPDYIKVGDTAVFGTDIYAYVGDIYASGTDVGHYSTPMSAPLYYDLWPFGLVRLVDNPYAKIDPGVLTIKKAKITISTDSDEKEYDGETLTAGGTVTLPDGSTAPFTYEGGAVTLLTGDKGPETLNIRATGEQTEIGESENGYEVDWGKPDEWGTEASTAKKYNYEIVDGDIGTLTVKPIEVTIYVTLSDKEVPYNGEDQGFYAEFSFDTDNEQLKAEENYGPTYTGARQAYFYHGKEVGEYQTNVGDGPVNFRLSSTSDEPWLEYYNPTYVVTQGTLTITAVPATVTFKLAGGNYDGDTSDVVVEANVGETITILDAPTREGYDFQYWKGSKYNPGDEYVVDFGGHTFTAVWAKANTGGDDSDKDGKDGDGSGTGDNFGLIGIIALMAAALLGLVTLTIFRRREE